MASLRQRFFGRRDNNANNANTTSTAVGEVEISEGNLRYVVEQGGNDSPPSYQEASGAPVEVNSPLGYTAGPITIILLNISKMIGTGVYSTRKLASCRCKEAKLIHFDCNSIHDPQGNWFCWPQHDLLVHRPSDFPCLFQHISRIRVLLPQQIRL